MAGSTEFVVNITIQSKDRTSQQTNKASKSLAGLKKFAGAAAVALGILKTAELAIKAVKFGAAIDRQKKSLNALAKAAGTSGAEITKSIQGAAGFTIDRMGAMQAANKAMLLDVAKSPEQFERLTKVATRLGRVMGQDATKSIDDFVTAAGRQSKQIADNLGLMVSSADANVRWARTNNITVASMDDATRKQAFLTEMLRQGEIKLGALGDTGLDALGKIEKVSASWSDFKSSLAESLTVLADTSGALDFVANGTRAWADVMEMSAIANEHQAEETKKASDELDRRFDLVMAVAEVDLAWTKNGMQAHNQYQKAIDDTNQAVKSTAPSISELANTNRLLDIGVGDVVERFNQYQAALNESAKAMDNAAISAVDFRQEQAKLAKEQEILTQKIREAAFDQGIAWTSHFANVKSSREENKRTVEEIETEHAANVLELQKKGQARSIRINEVGEKAKLEALQKRLEIALLQQSEFTDKTKASTQLAKENQIATLQSQIGTQTTLLDDFYAGRLVAQGANIETALAAENARYAEELALAQEQQALQEEEQRQSLGRMLIQQFTSWAQLKQIPADKMLEMKNAIALEYGLITEESANAANLMIADLERWAAGTDLSTADIVSSFGTVQQRAIDVTTAINAIPTSKTVNIDIKVSRSGGGGIGGMAGTSFDPFRFAEQGSGPQFQRGANFTVPSGFNDNFPMRVSSGERVIVIPRDQNTTNNFTLNSSTRATQPRVDENFQMMAEMAA